MLGESPVWDVENGWLYWVDGFSRRVRRYEPASGAFREWKTPSMVGSVALGKGETLVVGLTDGLYMLDLHDGAFSPMFRPDPVDPRIRFNDGKIDREGRFLCGSMGIHADPLGTLWRLDASGAVDALETGIRISNALAFSPDGRVMYFADSLDHAIRAYPYGDTVGAPRILVDTSQWGSGPDGATVDSEGFIWVCLIQTGKIARFAPDGTLDRLLDAPVDLPSSLAFGGDDLSTLFVTSIKDSGSGRAVSKHPDGGRLFAITGLGVRGLPEGRFGIATSVASYTEFV
ncbi:MAG: SMP-30/gluconolactonase/LRE family protein [Aliihoeflea sp.]